VPIEALALRISLATQHNEDLRDNLQTCDEIEGISINPVPEVIGVSTISNEACTTVTVGTSVKSSFIKADPAYQDLLDYLARPRIINSGSANTVRTNILNVNLNRTNLLIWFPNLLNRLAGVYGIRFTTKFTFMTASNPFQAAVFVNSFQYGTDTSNTVVYPRFLNSAYVTNLPHVKHDLVETTMSILDVPFLYPQDFMPLYTGTNTDGPTNGSIGIFAINQLMPYRVLAGSNSPTWKLMVSLHDVELVGSMPLAANALLLQSGLDNKLKAKTKNSATLAEERSVKGSDIARKAATVIRTVSPYVPFLGSIGAVTANILDVGANVAKAFGYAKPGIQEAPSRVWRNNHIGDANVDMDSASYVLAPFQSNRLAVDALAGGTEVDEMAIMYVIGKYGQCFLGTMTTTDLPGTAIYGSQICPTNFWFRTNAGRPGGNLPLPAGSTATTNTIACSPLCYSATFFRYWRGTLKFKFTFCKTKFHGGRVLAAYVPTYNDAGASGILGSTILTVETTSGFPQPFSYSQVFDLRDASSFEFEVPYVAPAPFTNVLDATGSISLVVLDTLITTGETASTIDFLVEVKAEEDFQFACPAPPMFAMLNAGATPSTSIVAYQSGMGGVSDIDNTVTQYTVGETVLSFKSLMMIPSYYAADFGAGVANQTTLWPYWFSGRVTPAVPLPITTTVSGGFTRAANIAAMYAFVTGSTEHHLYSAQGGNSQFTMSALTYNTDNGVSASSNGDPRTRSNSVQRIVTTDNALHVRVPSYQQYARIPLWDGNNAANVGVVGTTGPLTSSSMANHAQVIVNNSSAASIRVIYGRAAGDDARCMSYIGPPPVALLQGTQTAFPDNTGTPAF